MNSRELVGTALEHREPDRVRIDLGGTRVTGINAVGYHRPKRHLGIDAEPVKVADIILQLGDIEASPPRRRSLKDPGRGFRSARAPVTS